LFRCSAILRHLTAHLPVAVADRFENGQLERHGRKRMAKPREREARKNSARRNNLGCE